MRMTILGALVACTLATPAMAAPGMGGEVYGATVEAGEPEIEAIYGALDGGADDGEDVIRLEASYGVSNRLRIGVQGEWEKEPGGKRKGEAVGIEAIYALGKAGGVDFAAYGEYEFGLNGNPDKVEAKLLMQRRSGPLDVRLNLIAEKPLVAGEDVELEYAASADVEAIGEVRLGVAAFGELGTFKHFLPRAEHFVGPVAKAEIEGLGPEIGIEAGYLFPLGAARDDSNGQFRLKLEVEF